MKFVIITLISILTLSARADIYDYEVVLPQQLNQYFSSVNQVTTNSDSVNYCPSVYQKALDRGVFEVRYALGYFDDSRGHEVVESGMNYGFSPSLDIAVFNALRYFYTQPCSNVDENQKSCGFEEVGDAHSGKVTLQKPVYFGDREILFKIVLTHASASEGYNLNKGLLSEKQAQLTEQSERNYFDAIGSDDVDAVFYNGHSRNGGGPDFNPPVLNSARKTDYVNYYQVRQVGIKKLLEKINTGTNKNQVMGLFSCYSQKHFYNRIMSVNPQQKIILSSDTIDYIDSLLGSTGYIEGFLNGTCGDALNNKAKRPGANINIINGFYSNF